MSSAAEVVSRQSVAHRGASEGKIDRRHPALASCSVRRKQARSEWPSGLLRLTQGLHTRHTDDMPSASKSDTATTSPVADFERSLDELEQIVQRMEAGDLSLDDSLGAYERGVSLYRQCRGALDQAELRVKLLSDPLDPDSAQDFAADAP